MAIWPFPRRRTERRRGPGQAAIAESAPAAAPGSFAGDRSVATLRAEALGEPTGHESRTHQDAAGAVTTDQREAYLPTDAVMKLE